MDQPLQPLVNDPESLNAAWCGVRPAFGSSFTDGDGTSSAADAAQVDLESMSDAGLVATRTQ